MKKIIVLLLALAFIGGAAFAQDPTMVKFADPVITAGVSAYFGYNALTPGAAAEPGDGTADLVATDLPEFGGYKLNSDSYAWVVAPWFQMVTGILTTKITGGYYGLSADGTSSRLNLDVQNSIAAGGVTATNRLRVRSTGSVGNTTTLAAAFDNVSGRAVFDATVTGEDTVYGAVVAGLQTAGNTDWEIKISDFFNGFMDVKVGGKSTSYYHYDKFRPTALRNYWSGRSYANTNTAKRWIGTDTMIPMINEFYFGELIEALPLVLRTGFKIDGSGPSFRSYFEGYNNVILAAEYGIEGIGTVNVGWLPGFATSRVVEAGGVYTVDTRADDVMNTFFLDFGLSAVPNLTAQLGFEVDLSAIESQAAGATTGAGTAASPFSPTYVSYNTMNVGLEFVYDLADVLAGLEVDGALAVATGPGYTQEQLTGTAFTAPAAPNYVAANYTEANLYTPDENFILGIGAAYELNENNSFSISNTYTSKAGDLNDTWANAYGYYNTNEISLGYTTKAGKGTLGISGGYTIYVGLPTAAQLGITAASAIAQNDVLVTNTFGPYSVSIKYTAAY